LALAAASPARAGGIAKLDLAFPPMPVDRVGVGLMLAEQEPFQGTLTVADGTVLPVTDGAIPPTYVRGLGLHKTVDQCVGTAAIGTGSVIIDLPPEPVAPRDGVMTALAISATVTVTLPDGTVGTGTVLFPDCPTPMVSPGHYLAAAVEAVGQVEFP
jgi:hypothetical protein